MAMEMTAEAEVRWGEEMKAALDTLWQDRDLIPRLIREAEEGSEEAKERLKRIEQAMWQLRARIEPYQKLTWGKATSGWQNCMRD